MSTEVKEKRKRNRRNFQSDLAMLRLYCTAQVSALDFIKGNLSNVPLDGIVGQIAAYSDVLRRIDGGAK